MRWRALACLAALRRFLREPEGQILFQLGFTLLGANDGDRCKLRVELEELQEDEAARLPARAGHADAEPPGRPTQWLACAHGSHAAAARCASSFAEPADTNRERGTICELHTSRQVDGRRALDTARVCARPTSHTPELHTLCSVVAALLKALRNILDCTVIRSSEASDCRLTLPGSAVEVMTVLSEGVIDWMPNRP